MVVSILKPGKLNGIVMAMFQALKTEFALQRTSSFVKAHLST